MVNTYIPDTGDIVWLIFDPQAGHEQAGRRPALILSPKAYNGKTGLCLLVPITSKQKGYPFELPLPKESSIYGVILCDQVRNLDWQARKAEFVELVDLAFVRNVLTRFLPLVDC